MRITKYVKIEFIETGQNKWLERLCMSNFEKSENHLIENILLAFRSILHDIVS